jgi:hypothetical protein
MGLEEFTLLLCNAWIGGLVLCTTPEAAPRYSLFDLLAPHAPSITSLAAPVRIHRRRMRALQPGKRALHVFAVWTLSQRPAPDLVCCSSTGMQGTALGDSSRPPRFLRGMLDVVSNSPPGWGRLPGQGCTCTGGCRTRERKGRRARGSAVRRGSMMRQAAEAKRVPS